MSLLSNEEISLLNTDSKFRNYVSSVEKALKNFESSTEWADLIASLNKLKKVFTSTKYTFIPKRVSVCKRLAQCLHPALPSGVHLKALEVYTVIFQNIGVENLARDLSIYTSGLFPLLANAGLPVKPVLIGIYEQYFLPLKKALRPCLIGLILGILPGLEEGADYYTRSFTLLKNICIAQSDSTSARTNGSRDSFESSTTISSTSSLQSADEKYFYSCLWSAIVAQSSVRFSAIQFILANYELKKKANTICCSDDDQLYLIGNSIDLMINGICCCLQDSNSLVKRSILDFVCLCLPLNTTQITKNDKLQLIVVALTVVLKRDMSLNRRIYTWLMGNSNKPVEQTTSNESDKTTKSNELSASSVSINSKHYFDTHAKSLLISSIKMLLNNKKEPPILYLFNEELENLPSQSTMNSSVSTSTNFVKTLKIVSNLVERQEIGQSIVDEILLDLLLYVYKEACSLVSSYNQGNFNYTTNSTQISHSIIGHKRTHSNLVSSAASSSTATAGTISHFKDLDELKRATYNFLFESFQRYFIWEFCANKFEIICRTYTDLMGSSTNVNINLISPGQLCDLYEFILDLFQTNEMSTEIQSEYLPIMLKRIIKTLNTYCSKMTNTDLSKSILLCSKILKKVIPDIMAADQQHHHKQTQRIKSDSKPKQFEQVPQQESSLVDDESVISDLINEIITKIESEDLDETSLPVNDLEINYNNNNNNNNNANTDTQSAKIENNDFVIESCVFYLKQLCHTFIRSHLIQSSTDSNLVQKSFQSLFNLSSLSSESQLCAQCVKQATESPDESNKPHLVQLKSDSLNYLQSFQILNKFLIKLLFFPREKEDEKYNKEGSGSNEQLQDESSECCKQTRKQSINKLIVDSFDEWVKDLFVISCSSHLANSTRLFEFQSVTLNTLIELIHLSESVNAHYLSSRKNSINLVDSNYLIKNLTSNTARVDTNNSCFIYTVFTNKQIDLVYNQSEFGVLIAKMLWSHLSNDYLALNTASNQMTSSSSQFSLLNRLESTTDKRASILFCLLHETLPTNICEDIIAQNLLEKSYDSLTNTISAQMDALKRFIRLWHWSREINSSDTTNSKKEDPDDITGCLIDLKTNLTFKRTTKTFERSLLIILDMLNDKSTPTALVKLIQEWLVSLICDYNDLPRILDILLVSLLQPSTARVSVQFFITNLISNSLNANLNLTTSGGETTCEQDETDYESKVYAISNEGGNVKYHVNNNNNEQQQQNKRQTQQQFLLTQLNSSELNQSASSLPTLVNGTSTSKLVKNPNVELPLSILNASSLGQGINLRINPFVTKTSETSEEINANNDDSTDDHLDDENNQSKNASLLEKCKQLKVNQLNKLEKEKLSVSTSNSTASSPSHLNKQAKPLETDNVEFNLEETGNNNEDENIMITSHDENETFEDEENYDEDDSEDESDLDSEFNLDENYNQYDDTQSQSTDITLLKDEQNSDLISTYSSQVDSKPTRIDDRKHKRKSDLILPNKSDKSSGHALSETQQQQALQQQQIQQKKSASLTGRYKSKPAKSKENSPKSKLSALNTSQLTLREKSATIGSRHPVKTSQSPCFNLRKPFVNSLNNNSTNRELLVDALNSIDSNYSYFLIYSNCNNMQATQVVNNNKLVINSVSSSSYDHTRTLFVLRCLDKLLVKCPKEFLTSITRTNIASNSNAKTSVGFSVHNEKLLDLIIRHLKSIYGSSYYSDKSAANSFDLNKINFNLSSVTYIELITIVLLFFIRSYYPPSQFSLLDEKLTLATTNAANNKTLLSNSISTSSLNTSSNGSSVLSQCSSSNSDSIKSANTSTLSQSSPQLLIPSDLLLNKSTHDLDEKLFNENRNVQIYSLHLLGKLIRELSNLCKFSNTISTVSFQRFTSQTGFLLSPANQCTYQPILDLLEKSKLQKTLLHCFYSTISTPGVNTLAQCILTNAKYFKEPNLKEETLNSRKQTQYAYMCELMDALENLIQLEKILNDYQVISKINRNNATTSSKQQQNGEQEDDFLITLSKKVSSTLPSNKTNNSLPVSNNSTRYLSNQSICNQSMFISSVLHYLKNINLVEYHLPILKLVRNSLPSAGNALKPLSTFVIEQLCRNLLQITNSNVSTGSSTSSTSYMMPAIAYMSSISAAINIPDLIISIIKQLSYLLHYCLLSNLFVYNDLNSNSLMNQFMMSVLQNPNLNETQIKLFKQYQSENETYLNQAKESLINILPSIMSSMTQVWQRCNLLLNSNANAVNVLFEPINQHQQQQQYHYSWILGHPTIIKQAITEMLNPIVQYHGTSFMIAIAAVWGEKRRRSKLNHEHKVIIEIIKSLNVCSLPVILQNIIEILKQSNSTSKDKKKSPLNVWLLQFLHSYLESFALELKETRKDMRSDVNFESLMPALCNFFKECLSSSVSSNLIPACYFQLFRILHDSVNNFSILVDDKKYSKEIQDSTHKLFEICNSIVASSLQQTTWLRKNYAVKLETATTPQPTSQTLKTQQSVPSNLSASQASLQSIQTNQTGSSNSSATTNNVSTTATNTITNPSSNTADLINQSSSSIGDSSSSGYAGSSTMISSNSSDAKFRQKNGESSRLASLSDLENEGHNISDASTNLNCIDHLNSNGDLNDSNNLNHSLQALNILAEYLAKTLDIVYKSEEKERLVIPLLTSLMFNLWPYLRTHLVANKNNFRAASHLLMSLTIYPYTRKTWKKEVLEMLFDSSYFHVDAVTLDDCKTIIDNLISNDRQMFKDVLVRVQYQQTSGLFTSKEQESEQKAQLLKRLAFVIYSSEKDQYQRNMPEIQECISHILKLVQSPNLYSTLFLLFRILLLRISGRHLIALWPTILTELIIILLQMEQDLTEDIESRNTTRTNFLEHIANTNSALMQSNAAKLQVYLSACKLIDLILTLPNTVTAQFQMTKWSFIAAADSIDLKQREQFVPYLNKINSLLKAKFPNATANIIINQKSSTVKFTSGPLIRQRQIQSLAELKPFFEAVNSNSFVHNSNQLQMNQQATSTQQQLNFQQNYFKQFEASVHEDFLEGWIQ